jgi:hypothetical protein
MRRKKATLGDILEVTTPRGLAYLQYTHEEGSMGSLVRVLPGLFPVRPKDLFALGRQKEVYFTFYTLDDALKRRDAEIVSNQPIPESARAHPIMRAAKGHDATGKTHAWTVVRADMPFTPENLKRAPKYTSLTPDLAKLSIHQIWPHGLLVKRLAQEWTPERAEEFRLETVKEYEASEAVTPDHEETGHSVRHYLYFPQRTRAEEGAQWFRAQGFEVEVRPGTDGENWLTLVKRQTPNGAEETDKLHDEMEALASQLGGEYDGWETEV